MRMEMEIEGHLAGETCTVKGKVQIFKYTKR